jgi:hypothetical protein
MCLGCTKSSDKSIEVIEIDIYIVYFCTSKSLGVWVDLKKAVSRTAYNKLILATCIVGKPKPEFSYRRNWQRYSCRNGIRRE